MTERLHNLWRQQQQIRFLPASTALLYSQNRWKVCSPCKFLWLSGSSVCWTIQRKLPGYSLFFCWRNSEGQKFNCHWNSQAASWSVAIRFPFTVSYVIFDYSCVTGLPYGCPRVFSEQTLERILQGQYNWVSPRKHESRLKEVVYLVIKILKAYSGCRYRWSYFFSSTDLEKFSITWLAHKWILCSEWVPSEWESKQCSEKLCLKETNPSLGCF